MNYECPECDGERFRFHNMRVHLKIAHGYSAQDVMQYEDEVTV